MPEFQGNRLLPEPIPPAQASPVLRGTPTPERYGSAVEEGIPLGEYVAALRRYAWLVVAAVVLSMGFAWYKLQRQVPHYAAASTVRLVNAREEMAGDIAPGQVQDAQGWYTDPILSQIQLLRSRAVAAEVVDTLGLRLRPTRPGFPRSAIETIRVSPGAPSGDTVSFAFRAGGVEARMRGRSAVAPYGRPLDLGAVAVTFTGRPVGIPTATFQVIDHQEAVLSALGAMNVVQRELTNVIDIQFTADDPVLAKQGTNAFAAAFRNVSMRSAQTMSRRRRQFVEEQLRQTDALLLVAQRQLSDFRRGVRAFSPREKFRVTEEGLAGFRLQRQDLLSEKQIYDQMARGLASGSGRESTEQIAALAASPEVSKNAGIVSLYTTLLRYQSDRDSLTTGRWSRAASNPDVQQLDSLISTYRGRLMRAVEARSDALAARIAVLDQVMSEDAASISGLPEAEADEMRLSREVETLQKLVDDLRREQQEARIDEAVEAGQVDIVDLALAPGTPVGSGAKRRLLFALLIGLMLGGGGALVLDRLNTAISRREDVEAAMRAPVVAVIPRLGEPPRAATRLGTAKLLGRGGEPERTEQLVAVNDVQSAGSQAYRKLRTHLIFAQHGMPMRTLLVTSPGASEGKTTVTANLAATFAQQGLRVCVIDADLRRARLHGVYGLPRAPGLTEVLLGEVPLDEALRPSKVEKLHVLAAGRLVPHVSELLGGPGMGRLMRVLSGVYDLVVVDTPPVLAAADAEILGAQSDALLMVVRAGQTERHSAQHAADQLRAVGARIVGIVLNDPDQKIGGHEKYAYYYDSYTDEVEAERA